MRIPGLLAIVAMTVTGGAHAGRENPHQRIVELLEIRDPLYRETSDITLDTDGHNVRWVVDQILARMPS